MSTGKCVLCLFRLHAFMQANAMTNAATNARPTRRHSKTHQDARHLGLQLSQLFTTNSCARVLLGERESGRARALTRSQVRRILGVEYAWPWAGGQKRRPR